MRAKKPDELEGDKWTRVTRAGPAPAEAARLPVRESLFAAASDLLREASWSKISMAALAERAGVSRQTLYNEFRSREEFGVALAMREAGAFLTSVERVIARHAKSPVRALAAAFEGFLVAAGESPMVRAILSRDPGAEELFALFSTRGGPVLELATERIVAAVRKRWPESRARDVRIAAECLVRLAISHASLPTSPPARAAEAISALIGPYVLETLTPRAPVPRLPRGPRRRISR